MAYDYLRQTIDNLTDAERQGLAAVAAKERNDCVEAGNPRLAEFLNAMMCELLESRDRRAAILREMAEQLEKDTPPGITFGPVTFEWVDGEPEGDEPTDPLGDE